jgi:hypothetical protein
MRMLKWWKSDFDRSRFLLVEQQAGRPSWPHCPRFHLVHGNCFSSLIPLSNAKYRNIILRQQLSRVNFAIQRVMWANECNGRNQQKWVIYVRALLRSCLIYAVFMRCSQCRSRAIRQLFQKRRRITNPGGSVKAWWLKFLSTKFWLHRRKKRSRVRVESGW